MDDPVEPTNEGRTNRAIINVNPEWPFWERALANIVNAIPVFLWGAVVYFLLSSFESNAQLSSYGAAYMNLVVRGSAFGILTLIAGVSLLSWLHPYFNPMKMMRGSDTQQLSCVIYWSSVIIGLSIIIASSR